jgi:CRP-like cAMP-binding protein
MQSVSDGPASPRQIVIRATLRQSRMFATLTPGDLATVAEGCSLRTLQKGEQLFREGEKAEGFYVMQAGAVSVFRLTPDGREQIICVFRPPESFAEVILSTIETYPANAVALEPSQVVVVSKARFRELVQRQPELSLHMLGSMSLHLKHLVQSLQDIKGRQIEHRLAHWLLHQAPDGPAGGPVAFKLPVTKKVLAGQLGVASETLSRTLARFRREGLIIVEGARVRLVDPAGLRSYAEI